MTKIICLAVRIDSCPSMTEFVGKVFMGHRHNHALAAMNDELSYHLSGYDIQTKVRSTQGFITSEGEFVGRKAAYVIAVKAGQTVDSRVASLYSEDLY